MPKRHRSFDDELAQKFEKLDFAQQYLIGLSQEEDISLEDALRHTVKAMGLLEFSERSGLSIQAVSDFVSNRAKWSTDKIIKKIYIVFKLNVKFSLEKATTKKSIS